jgi:HEAT repeat protein
MVLPTVEALAWIVLAAAAGFAITGAMVIGSRVRYERRRRLLDQVEKLLIPAAGGRTLTPSERWGDGLGVLARAPVSDQLALLRDGHPSWRASEAIAESLVERFGSSPLIDVAISRRNRDAEWRILALRILAFARSAERWRLLAAAVADGTPDVTMAAITLLGQLGDRRSAIVLIGAMHMGRCPRSRVAAALDAFMLDLSDLISPLLDSPDAGVRYWGTALIERYPHLPGLDERLAALTTDSDRRVRKAALAAIGVTQSVGAMSAVRARLGDRVGFVRACAARTLAQLQGAAESERIVALLADRDWTVRESAKQSLRTMSDAVWPAVAPYLTHADPFARNSAAEVLQDVGVFDRLLAQEMKSASNPARVRALGLLAQAGGQAMVAAAIERLRADLRPRARQLFAATRGAPPPVKEVA